MLYSSRAGQGGEDKLYWVPSKGGLFDLGSFYNVFAPHDGVPFSWKCIWQNKVSLRVAFFASWAALGKILSVDNFRKRYVIVVDW